MKKTILINIFDTGAIRNILRTGVLDVLKKDENIKIVILFPEDKKEMYEKEFASENVIIDSWPDKLPSKIEQFALFVTKNSIPTHAVRQIQEVGIDGSIMKRGRYIFARVFWLFGHIYLWRAFVRIIVANFFNDALFGDVIKKYKPDLIFCPTIYSINDLRLLKYAKENKISVIGMIKSWDSLTSKDPLLIKPDYLIVHNEIIKKEAVNIGHYPEEKIFIAGMPQFDNYINENVLVPREEFLNSRGLDPDKKLILYIAVGACLSLHEKEMIELLGEIINSGELKYPAQLLVRLYPSFTSNEDQIKPIPNMVMERPGKALFSDSEKTLRDNYDLKGGATEHLINSLKWSDVSIDGGSTTIIESSLLDTPSVMIGFDACEDKNYWRSSKRLPKRDHEIPAVKSSGFKVANNKQELIKYINEYLDNRNLDKEGRQRLVQEQCYKIDGKAGERVAKFILSKI